MSHFSGGQKNDQEVESLILRFDLMRFMRFMRLKEFFHYLGFRPPEKYCIQKYNQEIQSI
jgi:hypothetical protein